MCTHILKRMSKQIENKEIWRKQRRSEKIQIIKQIRATLFLSSSFS